MQRCLEKYYRANFMIPHRKLLYKLGSTPLYCYRLEKHAVTFAYASGYNSECTGDQFWARKSDSGFQDKVYLAHI